MQIIDIDKDLYQWSDFELFDIHQQSFWVFDLEATGLNFNVERVTQFGGVAIEQGVPQDSTSFCHLVKPDRVIPDFVQEMTGITNSMVHHAPSFSEVFPSFVERAGPRIWVTQAGYEFDCPILLQECQRLGIAFPQATILDTKALFALIHPDHDDIFNTNFLVHFYGIDTTDLPRHDALGDARLIARIFQAQLGELQDRGLSEIVVNEPVSIRKSFPDLTPSLNWDCSYIKDGRI
jgi:DNA polymerase III epsilon subunit-like protein